MHKTVCKSLMMMGISFVTGVHPSTRQTMEQSNVLRSKSNPLDFTRATSFDTSPMCVGKGTMPNGFIDSRSFAMRGELPATRGEIQERPSNNTGTGHQRNLRFFSTFPSTGCTRRFYNLKFCSPQVNQKIKKSHEVNQSNWSAHANSCYSWASKNTICTTWAEEYSCCTVVDSP